MRNVLAYLDYDCSYDRTAVILQAAGGKARSRIWNRITCLEILLMALAVLFS